MMKTVLATLCFFVAGYSMAMEDLAEQSKERTDRLLCEREKELFFEMQEIECNEQSLVY